MSPPIRVLLCFAVREEAKPFRERLGDRPEVVILVTGIGQQNTEKSFRSALTRYNPELVISSGFAGALDPQLQTGAVVFQADNHFPCSDVLLAAGARSVRFHCAERVIITTAQKRELWVSTQANAVEMESSVIRLLCREHHIPSATVRVISDAANEDLPLDFNQLMTCDSRISYGKLLGALWSSPRKIPELIRFQTRVRKASESLALLLTRTVEAILNPD